MVAVTPGKRLGPDAQVSIGVELGPPVLLDVVAMLPFLQVAVVGGDKTQRDGGKEGDVAPGVGETHGLVLLRLHVLNVGARRASPRPLNTSKTDPSKRRHFLCQALKVKVRP